MEPDLDGLWALAVEALDEHERDEALAWLVGVILQPGQTEYPGHDVVLLLPGKIVFVRPDPFWTGAYERNQVSGISFTPGHVRFDVIDGEVPAGIDFWIDAERIAAEPFQQAALAWLATEKSSSGGCGVAAVALVVGVLALLFALGPADWKPVDSRLNTRSTCGEFLRAGEDRQLDLLRRLFQEAGRPADAEKPAVLTQSRRRCEENGSVTLDSLVTGR